MSVFIRQMVMRKRASHLLAQQFSARALAERDDILVTARGGKGEQGESGKAGRGIAKVEIVAGDLIVTYTDKKKHNAGRVEVNQTIVAGGSGGAADLSTLPPTSAGTPDNIALKVGGTWVQYGWEAFLSLLGATGGGTTPVLATVNGEPVLVNGQNVTLGTTAGSVPPSAVTSGGEYVTVT